MVTRLTPLKKNNEINKTIKSNINKIEVVKIKKSPTGDANRHVRQRTRAETQRSVPPSLTEDSFWATDEPALGQ